MTQKEFYQVLSTIKGWYFEYDSLIRRVGGRSIYQCPITAVYQKVTRKKIEIPRHGEAAKALVLNPAFASDVADAADGESNKHRARLLKACNLKEKT